MTIESKDFMALFEPAVVGMALLTADRWIAANPALCRIVQYPPREWESLSLETILHPADCKMVLEKLALATASDQGLVQSFASRLVTKIGAIRAVEMYLSKIQLNRQSWLLMQVLEATSTSDLGSHVSESSKPLSQQHPDKLQTFSTETVEPIVEKKTPETTSSHKFDSDEHAFQVTRDSTSAIKPAILIVDDEDIMRQVLGRQVERMGFNVEYGSDGLDGLQKYDPHKIALVITDVSMPKLNGLQMLRTIQKANPNVKAIVVSGRPENKKSATSLGAEFFEKPYNIPVLLKSIKDILGDS